MYKEINFFASLPRSGSTLLASIMNQHPDIHASGTSALLELLLSQSNAINANRNLYEIGADQEINIYNGTVESYYKHINKRFIFDKHRMWPNMRNPLLKMGLSPKFIVTIRPLSEIITSYITLINKNPHESNNIDNIILKKGGKINLDNRVETIWKDYVEIPYNILKTALTEKYDNIYFFQYNEIVNNPKQVMDDICNKLSIDKYDKYDFNNIQNTQHEKDNGWGIKDLHKIRPQLKRESESPKIILGENYVNHFNKLDFKI
jgi:sulfotransferase